LWNQPVRDQLVPSPLRLFPLGPDAKAEVAKRERARVETLNIRFSFIVYLVLLR
jgi:hypothetical protein